MKIFRSNNSEVIAECRRYFQFSVPSELIEEKKIKFERNYNRNYILRDVCASVKHCWMAWCEQYFHLKCLTAGDFNTDLNIVNNGVQCINHAICTYLSYINLFFMMLPLLWRIKKDFHNVHNVATKTEKLSTAAVFAGCMLVQCIMMHR